MVEPHGVLAGKVVDGETGQPIRAFNVKLSFPVEPHSEDVGTGLDSRLKAPGQDFASNDGSFTIGGLTRRAAYAVIVSADGYALSRADRVVAQAADAKGPPDVIRMGKGRAASGTVLDAETGRAVADAEVVLAVSPHNLRERFELEQLKESRSMELWVQKAVVGPDGGFEFQHVAAWGHQAVVVRSPSHAVCLVRNPAAEKPLAIRLERGGTIEGTAKDVPGLALKKTFVEARGEGIQLERVPLFADGTFRIGRLPAGEWTLTLLENWDWKQRARVKVAAGQTARLDFANPPGVKVSGRVTRGGAPLPGAHVGVSATTDWLGSGTTDAAGRYTIAGIPPGDYRVIASQGQWRDEGWMEDTKWVTVTDKDTSVDFAFHAGRIEGRLLGANGPPADRTFLMAMRLAGPDDPPKHEVQLMERGGQFGYATGGITSAPHLLGLRATRRLGPISHDGQAAVTKVPPDGRFAIENLPPGDYVIYVSGWGPFPCFASGIRIEREGATAKCDVRLDWSSAFRVKAVDSETRRPVSGARIGICTPQGVWLSESGRVPRPGVGAGNGSAPKKDADEPFHTEPDGTFAVDGLQRADYGLWVVAPGYGARFFAPVAATPDKTPPETTIALERTGTLVLKAAPDLLKGLTNPYLAYRLCDTAGHAVYPGGESQPPWSEETGLAKLFGQDAPEWRTSTVPRGRYTLEWEVHQFHEPDGARIYRVPPAAFRGKAEIEIRKGSETVVPLAPDR